MFPAEGAFKAQGSTTVPCDPQKSGAAACGDE